MAINFITQAQRDSLVELYVGYFNRAPEASGLNYWAGELLAGLNAGQAEAAVLTSIADRFYDAGLQFNIFSEAQPVEDFIAVAYRNALGRDSVDAPGLAYWTGKLTSGEVSRGEFVQQLISDAKAFAGDATWGWVATYLENRTAVATEFAKNSTNLTGQAAIDAGSNALSVVTPEAAQAGQTAAEAIAAAEAAGVAGNAGQIFSLTAGVDTMPGLVGSSGSTSTAGNDTITATATTLTSLDTLDGGAGADTLNILDTVGTDFTSVGYTLTGIETVSIRSAAGLVKVDTSANAGVTALKVTQAVAADLTAGDGTAVSVSGATGNVDVTATNSSVTVTDVGGDVTLTGGSTQTVSLAAQAGVVDLTGATGAVSVTSAAHGLNNIEIDGGSTVTVITSSAADNGTITIGAVAGATGAVSVTSSLKGDGTTDIDQGDITVNGGSAVTVNSSLTINAKDETAINGHTLGDVRVNSDGKTTSVTVNQTVSVTEFTKAGVDEVKQLHTVTFAGMTKGDTTVVDGLTFTASKTLTAAEVAAAFSGLTASDTQTSGGKVANGVFTGALSANFTSGAANGAAVVFTAKDDSEDLSLTAGTVDPTEVTVSGTAAVPPSTSLNTLTSYGNVRVDGSATDSITTISLTGYASADLGNTGNDLNALTTLSLANSGGAATVDTSAAALALTLNSVNDGVDLSGAASLKALNVTATGADSKVALTAATVETLTVAGSQALDLTVATLTALKTVTVSGSAGLTIDASGANVTAVNTAATTGAVNASIDGTKATYTGGAGVDSVSLVIGVALSKAIDLGAGDDTVIFGASVTGSTAALSGGDGTDTLSMSFANADALDGKTQTFYTGFEHLTINNVAGDSNNNSNAATVSLDISKLGGFKYITTSGTEANFNANSYDVLSLDNVSNNATVVLTAYGEVEVNITDAATGTADVLNAVLSSSGSQGFGTLTAANVETINISTVDTEVGLPTKNVDALTLTADVATTLNLSGAQDLILDLTGSTALSSINAAAMTGNLSVTSVNTTSATTITGGTGDDSLTAAAGSTADILLGGGGNDTLTANAGLVTLTGGAGADTFVINTPSLNVNSYATITDAAAGDVIQISTPTSFTSAKVTLGNTAVFQDYANAVINAANAVDVAGWFQYGGDTYIVSEQGADSSSFVNGEDLIVKLTGLVDLSAASFNATNGTIELA